MSTFISNVLFSDFNSRTYVRAKAVGIINSFQSRVAVLLADYCSNVDETSATSVHIDNLIFLERGGERFPQKSSCHYGSPKGGCGRGKG